MKVLVTGATGQLGYDVCRVLNERGIDNIGFGSAECDVTDGAAVMALFQRERPDAVIHCAAYTAVDKAEDERDRCYAVNEGGTRHVAEACRAIGAKLVYISTDYVFPGTGESFYKPEDAVGAVNIYGKSKLAGEKAVEELLDRYYIVRTSWMLGKNGNNFIKTILKLAEMHPSLGVVCDQVGSPTYSADLAPLLCDMLESEAYGLYHATNEGVCSWLELAQETFRLAGKSMKTVPVTTEQYHAKALRPRNSRMSKDKLVSAGFHRLPGWRNAVARYMREMGYACAERTVAVTGAGGYIGRHVVRALLDRGVTVTAVARHASDIDPRANMLYKDIFQLGADAYDELGKPDVLVHMAWTNGFEHNHYAHIEHLPEHGKFIDRMLHGGLKQLAVMGSMHEVGFWEGPIDENTPTNPLSYYGIAKDALRRMCAVMMAGCPGVTFQWLRAFYIHGDDGANHSIFTKLLDAAAAGKKTFPFTSGKTLYDFITVEELAAQIAACVMQQEVDGVINCCSGIPESLASRVERFIADNALDIKLDYGAYPDRPYDSSGVWGDAAKIHQIIGQ